MPMSQKMSWSRPTNILGKVSGKMGSCLLGLEAVCLSLVWDLNISFTSLLIGITGCHGSVRKKVFLVK